MPLMQTARTFFTAFIRWMSLWPIRLSAANIRMPMPAPK